MFVVQTESKDSATERVGGEPWPMKSIGSLSKMPAPKTGDWVKSFGGWEGFTAEIHRSIGRNLGGGVLRFSRPN